jgi:hypothetical protein
MIEPDEPDLNCGPVCFTVRDRATGAAFVATVIVRAAPLVAAALDFFDFFGICMGYRHASRDYTSCCDQFVLVALV